MSTAAGVNEAIQASGVSLHAMISWILFARTDRFGGECPASALCLGLHFALKVYQRTPLLFGR